MERDTAATEELVEETPAAPTTGDVPEGDFENELTQMVTDALDDEGEEELEEGEEIDEEGEEGEDEGEEIDEEEEEDAPAGEAAAAPAPAAAAAAADPAAKSADPVWEPLAVKADRETFAIDEAKVSRANGHVFIAVPDAEYARFQQRLSRGVVGERLWRQLDQGLRELEARKSAPAPKSEAEIEAEIMLEALKPYLGEILDDKDLQLLDAKVKLAQREAKDAYAVAETTRVAKASEVPWEETQARGLAENLVDIAQTFPDLAGLTRAQLEEVYQELLPVRNAVFFREGEETFANTQYMYDRLKARLAAGGSTKAAPAPVAASASSPAPKGNPAATATKTPATAAERFNRGVDAAPRTTSVKANRTTRPAAANTRDPGAKTRRRSARDEHARAEDSWRKAERAFLTSNSLDFEPGDDGGEDDE